MMRERVKGRYLLFRCSIVIGLLLGLLLLVETVMTYRYVARGLVRQEAQREADHRMLMIARAARLTGIRESSRLGPVLREVTQEAPRQIAWIRVLSIDGDVVAGDAPAGAAPRYSREDLRAALEQRDRRPRQQTTESGQVLITLNPFRLPPPASPPPSDRPAEPPQNRRHRPELIEMALYTDGISVHFGPLRHNLIIGVSAAFALLGAVIIIALRFGNYLRGKEIEKELELARRVQLDLFLNENCVATRIQFAAECVPAWQVGGDLYDVFETDDHETALVVGDVSGKGLSAALLMGVVHGAIRASCASGSSINHEKAAERLNNLLCGKTSRERFVSLFWSYFDAGAGVLRYINAGHWPPLLMRGAAELDEVLRLEQGGPVLGVLPGAPYNQAAVAIEPGDLLVVFSDGILEASNSRQQQFGEERIIAAVERNWAKSPAEICNAILADVRSFIGNEAAQDDQTLLVARLEPKQAPTTRPAEIEKVIRV